MLEKDVNKVISGIFKDEDFEVDADFGVEDDNLDCALNEILSLKETLVGSKIEPISKRDKQALENSVEKEKNSISEHFSIPEPYSIAENFTQEVKKEVPTPQPVVEKVDASDELNKILEEITCIKNSLAVQSQPQEDVVNSIQKIENSFNEVKSSLEFLQSNESNTFTTTIINQLIKIKKLIGSDNIAEVQLNNELSALYLLEQKASKYIDSDNISFLKKFEVFDEFVQKLKEAYNYDIDPLIAKANELLSKLASKKLTKDALAALETYLNKGQDVLLPQSKVREIENYLSKVERLALTVPERVTSLIDEILSVKSGICVNNYDVNVDEYYKEYLKICETLKETTDKESIVFLRNRATSILSMLTSLSVGDVYPLEKINIKKEFKVLKQPANKSIYETLNELKNIISSGGVVSNDGKDGISSDISFIKEKLEIIQSENGNAVGGVVSALTLESVVGQLDRLFDDIKNVVDALENNVMDNLAIINDNVNIIKESVDKTTDKISALMQKGDEIHEIKEIVSLRYADEDEGDNSEIATLIENQNDMISSLLSAVNLMQEKMDRMSEELELFRKENAEIKKNLETVKVEQEDESFEEIEEIYPTINQIDAQEETEEDIDAIIEKIDDAIAGIK